MIITAKSTLNGILNATINVGFTSFKNNASTRIARSAPSNILCSTAFTIILMYSLWSINAVHERPSYLFSNSSKASDILSATALVFAVLDL